MIRARSSAVIVFSARDFSSIPFPKRLLKRKRPTDERSYRSLWKSVLMNSRALSAVAKSPSRRRLWISTYASEIVFAVSFASDAVTTLSAASSFLKYARIFSSVSAPRARRSAVTMNFLFRSIRA